MQASNIVLSVTSTWVFVRICSSRKVCRRKSRSVRSLFFVQRHCRSIQHDCLAKSRDREVVLELWDNSLRQCIVEETIGGFVVSGDRWSGDECVGSPDDWGRSGECPHLHSPGAVGLCPRPPRMWLLQLPQVHAAPQVDQRQSLSIAVYTAQRHSRRSRWLCFPGIQHQGNSYRLPRSSSTFIAP